MKEVLVHIGISVSESDQVILNVLRKEHIDFMAYVEEELHLILPNILHEIVNSIYDAKVENK